MAPLVFGMRNVSPHLRANKFHREPSSSGQIVVYLVERLQLVLNGSDFIWLLVLGFQNVRVLDWKGTSIRVFPFWQRMHQIDQLPPVHVAEVPGRFIQQFVLCLGEEFAGRIFLEGGDRGSRLGQLLD